MDHSKGRKNSLTNEIQDNGSLGGWDEPGIVGPAREDIPLILPGEALEAIGQQDRTHMDLPHWLTPGLQILPMPPADERLGSPSYTEMASIP